MKGTNEKSVTERQQEKLREFLGSFLFFVLMTHEARQNEGRGKRRKISNLSTKVTITEC